MLPKSIEDVPESSRLKSAPCPHNSRKEDLQASSYSELAAEALSMNFHHQFRAKGLQGVVHGTVGQKVGGLNLG